MRGARAEQELAFSPTASFQNPPPHFTRFFPSPHPHPLSHGGTIVTYGGLARKPVTLGAGALIFKDIRAKGFWLSSPARAARRRPDMDTVARLLQDGVLSTE